MRRITNDMVFSVDRGTDEQLAETLRIFERDGFAPFRGSKESYINDKDVQYVGVGDNKTYCEAYTLCETHYTPEQFHAEFGETQMQGLSLDPKYYEARKLDKVKDAFKCPEGRCVLLAYWDNDEESVSIRDFDFFNGETFACDNYATLPGYEIQNEWLTYKEPEKPRRMTFSELHRARYNGFEIAWGANYERLSPSFADNRGDESVPHGWYCRPWGTTEWLELTIDLLPKEWGVK